MGTVKEMAYKVVKDIFAEFIETKDEKALARYSGACQVYEPIFGEFILTDEDRKEILGTEEM